MKSTKNLKKEADERKAFSSFALAVGWPADEMNVSSRGKPEPDILFEQDSGNIAFELLSATTEEFRQPINTGQLIYPNDLPLDQKLLKKIATEYPSEFPIELLIYRTLAFETDVQILCKAQDVFWNEGCGKFRRIWYCGDNGRIFLWHNNWWSELNVCA